MSNNLNFPQVSPNQNQKETTINDQASALDAAITESLAIDLSSGDASLTQAQFTRNALFVCSGHTTARNLTVYESTRPFVVTNSGTGVVTVTTGQGSDATVSAGATAILYCDGTDVTVLLATVVDTGIGEAPNDGKAYVRKGEAWVDLDTILNP